MPTAAEVSETLASFPDPETGRPISKTDQIHSVEADDHRVQVRLGLTSHSAAIADEVRAAMRDQVTSAFPGCDVEISIVPHSRPPARSGQSGLTVKSVLLVGSGKGGVGKSTVAASLAVSLSKLGSKVGLMDADVYGPSVPHLLGLQGRPEVSANKRIQPISAAGIPVMSMGFLLEPDQAVIWRGPMLHGSIQQFLGETDWGELDYLVIDMPPGTGDVALTLSQSVAIAGAIVVCTPQEVALLDAIKAISMFRKVKIPILGMVENMSGFECPDCGKTYEIFGRGGAREKAEELGVPLLGQLPIDPVLRIAGDEGRLASVIREDARASAPLEQFARATVRQLASAAASQPAKPTLPTL